ncbi:hypothetical protein CBOM_07087 [Ceraceosorus bombacis]|uniref:Uncharacterized protein n=1 Tax=Ceraceosorus bombacis TaxID=401625 RepID=A0A0N7L358_9BASI|nr:hypothetical protein CBOM_07087 [Ceraceosorus bombacis]
MRGCFYEDSSRGRATYVCAHALRVQTASSQPSFLPSRSLTEHAVVRQGDVRSVSGASIRQSKSKFRTLPIV